MAESTAENDVQGASADAKLQMIVARALWSVENSATDFPDAESRKAAFSEAQKTYRRQARKLLRKLEAKGIEMRLTQETQD